VFNKTSHLKRHQRIHSHDKPFKCTKCPRSFARASYLSGHNRIHTGERPYKCVQCSKVFAQKYYLRRHFRTHTGVKPFHCVHCHKQFTQKGSLTRHLKLIHSKNSKLVTAVKIEPLIKLENRNIIKPLQLEEDNKILKIEKCEVPILGQVSVKNEIISSLQISG